VRTVNHIVYGLGARKDGGCFLDLMSPLCNFVYNVTPTSGIKVFNPFREENVNDGNFLDSLYMMTQIEYAGEKPKKDYAIVKAQIEQFIKFKRTFIMRDILSLVRQFGMLITSPERVDQRGVCIGNFYIKSRCTTDIAKLFQEKKYKELLDIFIEMLRKELYEHIYVVYKEETDNIISFTISEMLACNDPYKWYNFIKPIIDDFDKRTGHPVELEY
jgi:hypothetical protein